MTLKEYLNQKDPVRFPKVEVTRKQFKIIATSQRAGREPRSLVVFRTLHPLLAGVSYLLIGERFYVMDPDGNPRAASVFHVKS